MNNCLLIRFLHFDKQLRRWSYEIYYKHVVLLEVHVLYRRFNDGSKGCLDLPSLKLTEMVGCPEMMTDVDT